MSILESISTELLHIIEAMHSVTNIDFTIVDENLKRIVSTSQLSNAFGNSAPENSVFHKCLLTGKQYFIEHPTRDSLCADCKNIENCHELGELCIPIHFKDKIIGVLGMCAFDEKAKNNLINNRDSYARFEHELSKIISTMVNEKTFQEMLEYRSSEFITLVNSLNEGIVILSNDIEVISTNKYINEKLNLNPDSPPPLMDILPPRIIKQLEEKNFIGEFGPFKAKGIDFIINANPINTKSGQQGIILVFSDFKKMKESVLKSDFSSDIITFDDIIGESEAIKQARLQAIQVAEKDVSVLIMGETGTGKEIFARAIHSASKRKNEVFIAINCGAIPETLIESELFGYEKGSFTGASTTGKMGKFEIAKDGTLFLDEVGELPLQMQVKLLRALEEKEITRVGGYTPIKVNPRIISATNRNLEYMVRDGSFRDDLYYRLNIVPIYIPPLRDRGYDVIILSRYFLNHFSKIYSKDIKGFTPECERFLLSYSFPGNIRELKNLIEYAIIFEENSYIGVENIKKKISVKEEPMKKMTLGEMTRAYEKSVIENYIRIYGDNLESKKKIAKELGISLATLYRKLEE